MHRPPGHDRLVLSASDLTAFLACGRLTHESLRAALGLRGRLPRDESPHAELLRDHGDAHAAPSGHSF